MRRPERKEARHAGKHCPRFQMPPADRWYERTIARKGTTVSDVLYGVGAIAALYGAPIAAGMVMAAL